MPKKEKRLYRYEIPIINYCGDGIFYQNLFIWSENFPTKEEVIAAAEKFHERDSKYPEYTGNWREVVGVLENSDFPLLCGNLTVVCLQIDTNFGKRPFIASVVEFVNEGEIFRRF